jgi:O-antigen ligase
MNNSQLTPPQTQSGPKSWLKPSGQFLNAASRAEEAPNSFVRAVFCISAFAIPFGSLYIPGTGERLGVVRFVQLLILLAMVIQPAVCLRRWPVALSWFVGYCGVRLLWGLWMTPQLAAEWWPSTSKLLQFSLPMLLFLFNALHFRPLARKGVWAFALGNTLCALLHLAGVGVEDLDRGMEGRTSVLGENANVVGANYALALVGMLGLLLARHLSLRQRIFLLAMIPINSLALAMTGSRTAALMLALGFVVLLGCSYAQGARFRAAIILIAAAAILGGTLVTVPTVLRRFDTFRSRDPRAEPRARMLPVLWEMFLRNPVLGSGPDDYQHEMTQRAMPYLLKKNTTIVAHNLLMLLLVETGVVGCFIFARGVGMTLASAWRARMQPVGLLALAMIVPLTIAGITSSDPHYQSAFWFAVAYALAGRG